MGRQKIARSARWGAACAPCVAAKTRCVRSKSPNVKCDRCQSLEKDCTGRIHVPRKKRQTKALKTGQLEEKLNGFPGALHGAEPAGCTSVIGRSPNSGQGDPAEKDPSSSVSTEFEPPDAPNQEKASQVLTPGACSNQSAFTTCTCRAPVKKEDLVSLESDETLLSIFTNQLSTRFPFVIIPAGTTPRQLQETRPLLMKVIRMVSSVRHLRSIRGQYRAAIQQISDALLMRSERSIDLLQSILVVLGFYHYHCMIHAQFNNLTHLAVSLVGDMDLGTPPAAGGRNNTLPLVRCEEQRRTNEERRALAGVWYMSSNTALSVTQFEPVKYTKYLDQCLQELEDCAEYETDQLAVQLVRIQRVTEKIWCFHNSDPVAEDMPDMPQTSIALAIEQFHAELDELRRAVPQNLRSDDILTCHFNGAYMRLYDPLLAGAHLPDHEPKSLSSLSLSLSSMSVLEVFSRFTAALTAWLSSWLSLPVCSYFYLTQPITAQLIHAAMMISRWVRVAGPGAVMLCRAGPITSSKELPVFRQPLMAFSGVTECPDLGPQLPPTSDSAPAVSAQILHHLRAQVLAQPSLQVDVFGILDAMILRFRSGKKEIAAAQGGVWKNDTWDIAADHLELKKSRIDKWCETIAMAVGEEQNRPTDASDSVNIDNREHTNASGGCSLDWLVQKGAQNSGQWEIDLFDELMRDIHTVDPIYNCNGWGILDDMGLMD